MTKLKNCVIPLAGRGARMREGGYSLPKPMIIAGDKSILEWGTNSIDCSECNLIFVVRRDHITNFSIDSFLKSKYGNDITIVVAETDTEGSVSSCLVAKEHINNDLPLIIFCPDVSFTPVFKPEDYMFETDGFILTFKANSDNYSYVCMDEEGYVTKTAEKLVISENASVGVYCFKSGKLFVEFAEQAINKKIKSGNEYYIAPLYNELISQGGKVKTKQVYDMYIMGTPSELQFFKDVVLNYFQPRSFILCSDHSGFEKKQEAIEVLKELGIKYIDCGCYSTKDCDYSEFINAAVQAHNQNPGSLIIAACKSGQGVNIAGNKHKNIRGVLVHNPDQAKLGIQHNAANFFAMPASFFKKEDLQNLFLVLTSTNFQGGRHQNRLMKIFCSGI